MFYKLARLFQINLNKKMEENNPFLIHTETRLTLTHTKKVLNLHKTNSI